MKRDAASAREEASAQVRRVVDERALAIVFQPIFGFREGRIVGHEALVRGPAGSIVHAPQDLFEAARHAGLAIELNIVCIQEVLRACARRGLEGSVFLNISPQLIAQPGFDQERAARFMRDLGLEARNVVIELTEDYPTVDFRFVEESLRLYRAMGLRVAIDDLGEGFASLRLWSELRPEYVKADKHFVRGIAGDPVKLQFLRAIQHIAEGCGSQVIAEGIEGPDDFRVAKDIGIACGQGWFIGRPDENPRVDPSRDAQAAFADARVPVLTPVRLQRPEPRAADLARNLAPLGPGDAIGVAFDRFLRSPAASALPVVGEAGFVGLVSRTQLEVVAAGPDRANVLARPCAEVVDASPIRVEAGLELSHLTALLVESDTRRLADGFVVFSEGRYLGVGTSAEVMRALQGSRVLAARYTNPLTLLPGQVPINEHLERLLAARARFTAWFVEIAQMGGLNDSEGFAKGDTLIDAVARALESLCQPGVDFAGHVAGTRFVLLLQSDDWKQRAARAQALFAGLLREHVPQAIRERGYFVRRSRDGREHVRPTPKLAIGIVPVLPGVFETRQEVMAAARHAAQGALSHAESATVIDEHAANAYPASLLF